MANNVIIRGLNATLKFITRGFVTPGLTGSKVKICRVWTEPYICQKITTEPYICQKITTEPYIDMKVSTS